MAGADRLFNGAARVNQKRFYLVFSGEVAMNGAQTAVTWRPIGQRAHSEHAGPMTLIRAIDDHFATDECRAR